MLLFVSARPATATQNKAQESDAARNAVAAEYSTHAIDLTRKQRWSETGFTISPRQLYEEFVFSFVRASLEEGAVEDNVHQDARMKELNAKYPTLWKWVAPALAKKYVELQKGINHQQFPAVEQYRSPISKVLTRLVKIYGEGSEAERSEKALLWDLIPAETEWILKQMASGQAAPVSDKDFESALKGAIPVGDALADLPDVAARAKHAAQIKQAVAELRRAEQKMTSQQVAAERYEIITLFRQEE
jgi:hypothetical protein